MNTPITKEEKRQHRLETRKRNKESYIKFEDNLKPQFKKITWPLAGEHHEITYSRLVYPQQMFFRLFAKRNNLEYKCNDNVVVLSKTYMPKQSIIFRSDGRTEYTEIGDDDMLKLKTKY